MFDLILGFIIGVVVGGTGGYTFLKKKVKELETKIENSTETKKTSA